MKKTLHETKTNASRHTPGPWRIVEQTRIEADGYGLLAALRGEVSPHFATVTDANARLIAAAPKLLAALEAFSSLEVKGHPLLVRLQFSEEGRKVAALVSEALAEASTEGRDQ